MIRALTCGAVVSLLLGACCAPSMVAPRAWTAAAAPTSTAEAWTQLPGPVGRTGLRTLDDNAAAWAARWELVTQARATIDVGAFIFDHDVFGIALLGALLERAERGVAVRVLVDGRGSVGLSAPLFGRDSLQELVGTGRARVRVFHPVWSELLAALATLDAVPVSAGTHNKLLVVDGAQAIVGGRNVSTRSFVTLAEDPAAVRDADVVVDGADIVAALARVFDDEFAAAGDEVAPDVVNVVPQKDALVLSARLMDAWVRGEVPGSDDEGSDDEAAADADGDDALLAAALVQHVLDRFDHAPDAPTRAFVQRQARQLVRYRSLWGAVPQRPLPSLDVTARVVTTPARLSGRAGGRGDDNDATRALLLGIGGARRRIVLQTPSFVLSPALLEALRAAGERGVDIVVVTNGPRSTDSPIPQALFIDSWPEVMARVPRLRLFVERGPFMQHAKRAVFDDDLCFIGTFNLDPFSVQMNSETIVVTSSPRLASALQTQVAAVLPEMDEYRIARNVDGRARRHPVGTPHAGEVEVEFGPRDQVGADEIASLERTKALLLAVQPMFDFDVLVW